MQCSTIMITHTSTAIKTVAKAMKATIDKQLKDFLPGGKNCKPPSKVVNERTKFAPCHKSGVRAPLWLLRAEVLLPKIFGPMTVFFLISDDPVAMALSPSIVRYETVRGWGYSRTR